MLRGVAICAISGAKVSPTALIPVLAGFTTPSHGAQVFALPKSRKSVSDRRRNCSASRARNGVCIVDRPHFCLYWFAPGRARIRILRCPGGFAELVVHVLKSRRVVVPPEAPEDAILTAPGFSSEPNHPCLYKVHIAGVPRERVQVPLVGAGITVVPPEELLERLANRSEVGSRNDRSRDPVDDWNSIG